MKAIILAFTFALSFAASAELSKTYNCTDFKENKTFQTHGTQFQIYPNVHGKCIMFFYHRHSRGLIYRTFLFDDSGYFMIFNSFDWGSPRSSTGSRAYSFIPIKQPLRFTIDEKNQFIHVKTPSGRTVTIDSEKMELNYISDADFTVSEKITGDNQGGVEITPRSGTILDEGWRQGGEARTSTKLSGTFKDHNGEECKLPNTDIFKIIYDDRGRVDGATLIHQSKEQIRKFFDEKCPNMYI